MISKSAAPLPHLKAGFTLIELLVVITIMSLMFGLGLAAYMSFNDRQQVRSAQEDIKSFIRLAQTKARAGQMPENGCSMLDGYKVSNAGAGQLSMEAICDGAAAEIEVTTLTLNPSITAQNFAVSFRVLHGDLGNFSSGVWQGVNSQTVNLSLDGRMSYEFIISSGGEISEGEFTD